MNSIDRDRAGSRRFGAGRLRVARVVSVALLLLMGLVTQAGPAAGQGGIGVAPAFIVADNVLRGGVYTDSILLSNTSNDVDTEFKVSATGDIAEWVSFTDPETRTEDYSRLVVSAARQVAIWVVVDVPEDIPNGEYKGTIKVETANFGKGTGGVSTGVGLGANISVTLNVTGTEIRDGVVSDAYVSPSEVGLLQRFTARVTNQGNVRIQAQVQVDILREGEVEASIDNSDGLFIVDEGDSGLSYVDWDTSEFRAGDYQAVFNVYDVASNNPILLGTKTVAFRLEPRGTLTRRGSFEELLVANRPEVGAEARIEALFQNSGEIEVQAVFTGRLLIDGTEIRSIESLPRVVMPNSTSRLSFVIPIEVEGDYRVEGLVNFDGYESETLFVEFTPDPAGTALGLNSGGGEEDGGGIDAMLVLVIVLAVAVVGGGAWLIAIRRRSADGAGSLGAELAEPEAEEHETELVGPGA